MIVGAMGKTMEHIPESCKQFIESIVKVEPMPDEIWLIGSWANNRVKEKSDIDLLIFASQEYVDNLKSLKEPDGIDCLVVYDGCNFKDPWQCKSGSLETWKWSLISCKEAKYKGTEFISDAESTDEYCRESGYEMGQIITREERAWLLWKRP